MSAAAPQPRTGCIKRQQRQNYNVRLARRRICIRREHARRIGYQRCTICVNSKAERTGFMRHRQRQRHAAGARKNAINSSLPVSPPHARYSATQSLDGSAAHARENCEPHLLPRTDAFLERGTKRQHLSAQFGFRHKLSRLRRVPALKQIRVEPP